MSPQLVAVLAQIHAEVAIVEGMKAENAHRQACDHGIAYGEEAFTLCAVSLQQLAAVAKDLSS